MMPPEMQSPRDTNPNGWDDHAWLASTWDEVQNVKRQVIKNGQTILAVHKLVLSLDKAVVEGFKRFGVRLRDAEHRMADSQVDATEARKTAREVESTAIRTFVEDAKPFGRWKRDLVLVALGIITTVAGAALCHACGIAPIG